MTTLRRRIAVLGSTGSIGRNALEMIRQFPDRFECVALGAGRGADLFRQQLAEFRPEVAAVKESDFAKELANEFPNIRVLAGEEGMTAVAEFSPVEVVVMGIVGFAALAPTLAGVRGGKTVALANKESLVVGGSLLKTEVAKSGALVIPVDSEHNGLYQLLQGRKQDEVASLVLTASGGPLLRRPELPLEDVTPEIAIKHPNWKMGPKISVDSATLMNKGLEIIEASYLFDVAPSNIEVWIHPQSIVHAAVWLTDNSCLAQLSIPDMRSSIGYAMAYPSRLVCPIPKLSLFDMSKLEFYPPDTERFPALTIARQALEAGPSALIALNAANEIAVDRFLGGRLLFSQITSVIQRVLEKHHTISIDNLATIWNVDEESRRKADEVADSLGKH